MTWVHMQSEPDEHTCRPPRGSAFLTEGESVEDRPDPPFVKVGERPAGRVGDVWRCDDCRRLWRISESRWPEGLIHLDDPHPVWRPAGIRLRLRLRHRTRGAT